MSSVRVRTVDAFADRAFSGNPAAVVILDQFPTDRWMQSVAAELNLSETAFVVPCADGNASGDSSVADADFELRWFTPAAEVQMCGHATLASARCLFDDGVGGPIRFATHSGVLTVTTDGDQLVMDFPARPPVAIDPPDDLIAALGVDVEWVGRGGTNDVVCVLATQTQVRDLKPDLGQLCEVDARGVIVTAVADAGSDVDFVSRFFAPRVGVPEDPVTGSAHTVLAPYWAAQLGRDRLVAEQLSRRGGRITVQVLGDRVMLAGRAVAMFDGTLADSPA